MESIGKLNRETIKYLAMALKKLALEPYIVSESAGTQDIDAAEMKRIYFSL